MESKWGIIPDMSATVTLRELVPRDVALELTLTGRIFDAVDGTRPSIGFSLLRHNLLCRLPQGVVGRAHQRQDNNLWIVPEFLGEAV